MAEVEASGEGMKLYRIKKAKTPEYFYGWRSYDGKELWSKDGAFYRRTETIEHHLYLLCSKELIVEQRTFQNALTGIGFSRRKMKRYKIVITEVSQSGSRTLTAENFLKGLNP